MARPIAADSTDQSVTLYFVDSTTGLPKEGLTDASGGLALWYRRQFGAKTAISPAALAALTTAHTDGGFEEIDDGAYRVDLPDAAVATGVDDVTVGGSATGAIAIPVTHALNYITAAGIQTEANDALVANGLDHLVGASVAGADVADNSIVAKLVSKSATADWDDFVNTTDSLQANRDNAGTSVGASLSADIAAVPDTVWDEVVESTFTARQYMRGIISALMGKLSGGGTTTIVIRDIADTKNRITATVDADSNRTTVTRDFT